MPALLFVSDQIFERIARVESLEDRSIIDGEVVDSKDGVRDQPDDDDRSEKKGDLADSERLNDEEHNEDSIGDSDNNSLGDGRTNDTDTLNSTKD